MDVNNENGIELPEKVGQCKNCGSKAVRQQPYFSKYPIVNDGWYLYKCTNKDCHNYTGMELRDDELYLLDFIDEYKGLFNSFKRSKVIYLNSFKRKGGALFEDYYDRKRVRRGILLERGFRGSKRKSSRGIR